MFIFLTQLNINAENSSHILLFFEEREVKLLLYRNIPSGIVIMEKVEAI